MSAVPTKVEDDRLEKAYKKMRNGTSSFNDLHEGTKRLIENQKVDEIPENIYEKMYGLKKPVSSSNINMNKNNLGEISTNVLKYTSDSEKNGYLPPIINDGTVTIVDIANPPPFIKIGKHVFTTHEDKLSGKQSQTNFDLNGVGSVYTDLKKIYGVHPTETEHKYNLLLHNFGVDQADGTPLFEKGSCVPGSKDAVKQILQLGLAHLQAKKNSTRNRPLTNIGKVDAQIVELNRLLEKLKTMGESPVCDITQGAPQPPAVVPTVGKLGPVPNCLQDTKMLQSFLNMLTLMMGIMSDDDKRKNLKAVNLKDILAIGTKDPKNVTDANRQVVSEKIEALLKILQTVSTTDVNSSSDIQAFLKALEEDEELKNIKPDYLPYPKDLNNILDFFKLIIYKGDEIFQKRKQQLQSTIENYEIEIKQLTGVTEEQYNTLNIFFSDINKLIAELNVDGNENDEIMRNAIQKIQDLSKISAASPELQKTIEKMKEEIQELQKNLETSRTEASTHVADITQLQGKLDAETAKVADAEAALAAAKTAHEVAKQTELEAKAAEIAAAKEQATQAATQAAETELATERQRAQEQARQVATQASANLAEKAAALAVANDNLQKAQADLTTAQAELEGKNGEIKRLKEEHAAAIKEHEGIEQDERQTSQRLTEELQQLKSTHLQAIADKNEANERLQKWVDDLQSQIKNRPTQAALNEKNTTIAELNEKIIQNTATIDELTGKVAQIQNLQTQLDAANAEKDTLQVELAKAQTTSGANSQTIAQLESKIVAKDADILKCKAQAEELTAAQENITRLEAAVAAEHATKAQIQTRLAELSTQLAETTAERDAKEKEREELFTKLNTSTKTIVTLAAELESLRQANAAKDTEITSLKNQLTELQTKAKSATKKEDIETRLNTILPYLLVNDDLTNKIKTFMSTGVMDPTLQSSLEEHKSTMCMIFQMAYILIQNNNLFIDKIPYDRMIYGPIKVLDKVMSNPDSGVLYFLDKTNMSRLIYGPNEEFNLMKDLILLITNIFYGNTEYNSPIVLDMLQKKGRYYIGDDKISLLGKEPIKIEEYAYSFIDKIFPISKYGGVYESGGKILYTKTKDTKITTVNSYTRISVLLIMLTQLINKRIAPILKTFISNCGIQEPSYANVAKQKTYTTGTQLNPANPAPKGGDASELISFDEE